MTESDASKRFLFSYSQLFHVLGFAEWALHCHVWHWLSELRSFVLSYFKLSRSAIFTDVSFIEPEDSFEPLFKAVPYSMSSVGKLVNIRTVCSVKHCTVEIFFSCACLYYS